MGEGAVVSLKINSNGTDIATDSDNLRTPNEFSNSFLAEEGRRRQRIGALQIRGVIREMEGGNSLPPQRPSEDLRFMFQP